MFDLKRFTQKELQERILSTRIEYEKRIRELQYASKKKQYWQM